MPKHYELSPSGSNRWPVCTGSIQLSRAGHAVDEPSGYATEGTAAHEVAAKSILGEPYISNIDSEIKEHIDTYASYVKSMRKTGTLLEVECTIVSEEIPGFGGTVDAYVKNGESIEVIDFKFGAGVVVEADLNNTQLMCYLLLVAEKHPDAKVFWGTIVQPRVWHKDGPVRPFKFQKDDLEAFRAKVVSVSDKIGRGEFEFAAGPHCHWCPCIASCPHLSAITIGVAKEVFDEVNDVETVRKRWAEILRLAPAIKTMLASIPARMLGDMQQGVEFPGFKAVRMAGNRRWIFDDGAVLKKMKGQKIGKRLATEIRLKSPTQMTKTIERAITDVTKRARAFATVNEMVERPEKGLAVVPVSDSRPGVEFLTAKEVFSEATNKNDSDMSFLD